MSYKKRYESEVGKRLDNFNKSPEILTERLIEHLPELIQKYLHFSGAIDKPEVLNFRAVFNGSMKRSPESNWIKILAQQYNFFDEPTRLFYIWSSMFGIPFEGLHAYVTDKATMEIKLASLFTIVNAKGEKMNQSETVTFFNDMCLMAPATLISKNIQWEVVDSKLVKANFTNGANTISATLQFNNDGSLADFITDDRYYSADGKKYLKYRWSTPVRSYQVFNGRSVPAHAEAVWHFPDGLFPYARFDVHAIEYNCKEFIFE